MLDHAGLPKSYWCEAVMTATFLRNRCPTRAINHEDSTHEMWTMKKPLLKNLKVSGCHAYVHVPREKRSKLDQRAMLCRSLGYSAHEKAYRFEELSSGRVAVSRDAHFMEDTFDGDKRYFMTARWSNSVTMMRFLTEKNIALLMKIPTKTWARGRWSQDRSMNVHNGNSDKDRANSKLGRLM